MRACVRVQTEPCIVSIPAFVFRPGYLLFVSRSYLLALWSGPLKVYTLPVRMWSVGMAVLWRCWELKEK